MPHRCEAAVAWRAHTDQILRAAREHHCDAIHPGYGFLSENPALARRCADAGVTFVGPDAATLATLGDKTRAREPAAQLGVPVLAARRAASASTRRGP